MFGIARSAGLLDPAGGVDHNQVAAVVQRIAGTADVDSLTREQVQDVYDALERLIAISAGEASRVKGGSKMDSQDGAANLADEIAHCHVMVECLTGAVNPCSKVVLAQWKDVATDEERITRWEAEHHTPEPWVGDIRTHHCCFSC